jgi:hypothetical protein
LVTLLIFVEHDGGLFILRFSQVSKGDKDYSG